MANKAVLLSLIPDSGIIPFKHKTYFDELNIKCEYWDLRYLAQHERSEPLKPIYTPHKEVLILQIHLKDLEEEIKNNLESVFITGYRITRHNRIILQLFKKYNIRYLLLINTNTFFHLQNGRIRRKNVRWGNLSFILGLTLRKIETAFNKLAIDIQRPWLTIFGSINDKILSNYPEPKSGITYIHNQNYEKLIPILEKKQEEKYIVFLDQYLPWHPENQLFTKWKMNAETYYNKVATFLIKLAEETGKEPIIATHPKAEKGKIEPYVKGIKVVYGETPETIIKSKICILHFSTSVDQAVLTDKNILFVSCDEILKSPIEISTELMARQFNKKVLKIEEVLSGKEKNLLSYWKKDTSAYKIYITKNIKAGDKINIPYWEYIANRIKEV